MKKLSKKLCTIALAVSACMATPVMLVACGDTSDGEGNKTCTVTFDAGWGNFNGDRFQEVTVDKNSTVAEPSEKPVFDREDYMFMGWNVSGSDSDPIWNFDSDKITEDTTLRAVWVQAVTVTFKANGGTFADGKDTYVVKVPHNGKLTAPDVTPPDADKQLKGWHDGYNYWDFAENIATKDFSIKAQWELKDEIKQALAPFKYAITEDGYRIDGLADKTASGTVTVPSFVTNIGYAAFRDCENIESVVLHDNITTIPSYVFNGCTSLKSVKLPSGLTEISQGMFQNCTALEQIDLPKTLATIGVSAFKGCKGLKQIDLTDVKEIYSSAFANCTELSSVVIPAGITEIGMSTFEGCTSLKSITVPATCKTVNYSAFGGCYGLTSVELHCETLGSNAFAGCTALTDIRIGAEVRKIDTGAFSGCSALTEAEIPDTVTQLNGYIFSKCKSLKSVTLGDGISEIPISTFADCSALKSVALGSGIKTIGGNAFANCISLLSFTIPQSVETIVYDAFKGCSRLVEVYNLSAASLYGAGISSYATKHTDASEESIIISLAGGFKFCTYTDNVYPYVERLFLLDYTGNNQDLVLPDHNEGYKIFDYALSFNPQLKSVIFPASVTGVGKEILLGSDNVTELTVDGDNTTFSSAGNCVISTADKKLILGCKTSVIPTDGSVTAIGSNVFCHNATIVNDSFKIPDSVTVVGSSAFDGCDGIVRNVGHILYVDKWAVSFEDYRGDDKLDLEFISGTVGIAEYAFQSTRVYAAKNYIQSVKFNGELKYVGDDAFWGCGAMTSVSFNDGLLYIGGSAFGSCSKLQSVVIPDSVKTIGPAAFMGCTSLTYVKLPQGLTVIEHQPFQSCTALKYIVIPKSIGQVSYDSFKYCSAELTVYYMGSEAEWNAIDIYTLGSDSGGNAALLNATKYYYSETEIANGWHYDEDGNPTTEY